MDHRTLTRRITCFAHWRHLRCARGSFRSPRREDGCRTPSCFATGKPFGNLGADNTHSMRFSIAVYPARHPCISYGRPNCDGHMQWCTFVVCPWRLRDGEQVNLLCDIRVVIVLNVPLRCHLGKSIVYDTVSNLSWAVDIRTHTIGTVIEKLLAEPWPPSEDLGKEVPEPMAEDDCVVSSPLLPQSSNK